MFLYINIYIVMNSRQRRRIINRKNNNKDINGKDIKYGRHVAITGTLTYKLTDGKEKTEEIELILF